jgi:hypothetical protein
VATIDLYDEEGCQNGVVFLTRLIRQGPDKSKLEPTAKDKNALEKFISAVEEAGGKLDRSTPVWYTLYPMSPEHPDGVSILVRYNFLIVPSNDRCLFSILQDINHKQQSCF